MVKVLNVGRLNAKLEKLKARVGSGVRVAFVVGYTQAYAVWVHENLNAVHKVGQAKFLEQPAREKADGIADTVTATMKRGGTLEQGLLVGGLFLQRESQLLVPVDTGALKGSAFTRKEQPRGAA